MPTPELHVTKGGEESWRVRFRLGGRSTNPTSRTFTLESRAKWFCKLIGQVGPVRAAEILDGATPAEASDWILADWMEHHITQRSGITQGTRDGYRRLAGSPRWEKIAGLPVEAVTNEDVEAWVNRLAEQLAGKTVANHHGLLSAALGRAVTSGIIPGNPCDGIRLPTSEREEAVFLTLPEFDHLLSHVADRVQLMVSVMPLTGLRWGELTALQARDLDLDRGFLTVSRAWKHDGKSGQLRKIGPPKSKASRRTLKLSDQAHSLFRLAVHGKRPNDLVFTNAAGRPWLSAGFFKVVWKVAREAAMSEQLHPPEKPDGWTGCEHPRLAKKPRVHDMRHTCASWMLQNRTRIDVVQRYLGHESIKTTLDRYGHLDPSAMEEAAAALGAAVSPVAPRLPQVPGLPQVASLHPVAS